MEWKELRNIYEDAVIEENVHISAFCEIGTKSKIGKNTRIQAHCYLPRAVNIGENCYIGARVTFMNDTFPVKKKFIREATNIGNNVVIHAGCIIYPNVHIPDGTIILAGSVVYNSLPIGWVCGGNPCKPLKQIKNINWEKDNKDILYEVLKDGKL